MSLKQNFDCSCGKNNIHLVTNVMEIFNMNQYLRQNHQRGSGAGRVPQPGLLSAGLDAPAPPPSGPPAHRPVRVHKHRHALCVGALRVPRDAGVHT